MKNQSLSDASDLLDYDRFSISSPEMRRERFDEGKRNFRILYILILISSNSNELRFGKDKNIDAIKSWLRTSRSLNDVQTRNVFMHRIENNLEHEQ